MKKRLITGGLLIGSVAVLYGTGFFDASLDEFVDKQVEGELISTQPVIPKSDADLDTLERLDTVNQLIRRSDIKEENQAVLEEAKDQTQKQTELFASSKQLAKEKQFLNIDPEQVDQNIEEAYSVRNTDHRQKILMLNHSIKDDTEAVKRAETAMAELNEDPNFRNYYKAQSYVDAVKFEDIKETMLNDLKSHFTFLEEEQTERHAKEEEELRATIQAIEGESFQFESGSSTYHTLSPDTLDAFTRYPNVSHLLLITNGQVQLYVDRVLSGQGLVIKKTQALSQGFSSVLQEQNGSLSIGGVIVSANPEHPSAGLLIDPNLYDQLRTLVGQEVILFENKTIR